MEIILSERQLHKLAYEVALIMQKHQAKHQQPEYCTTAEAAKILRITPGRLRQIVSQDPYRYPHIKQGDSKQGKLLFRRDTLLNQ